MDGNTDDDDNEEEENAMIWMIHQMIPAISMTTLMMLMTVLSFHPFEKWRTRNPQYFRCIPMVKAMPFHRSLREHLKNIPTWVRTSLSTPAPSPHLGNGTLIVNYNINHRQSVGPTVPAENGAISGLCGQHYNKRVDRHSPITFYKISR